MAGERDSQTEEFLRFSEEDKHRFVNSLSPEALDTFLGTLEDYGRRNPQMFSAAPTPPSSPIPVLKPVGTVTTPRLENEPQPIDVGQIDLTSPTAPLEMSVRAPFAAAKQGINFLQEEIGKPVSQALLQSPLLKPSGTTGANVGGEYLDPNQSALGEFQVRNLLAPIAGQSFAEEQVPESQLRAVNLLEEKYGQTGAAFSQGVLQHALPAFGAAKLTPTAVNAATGLIQGGGAAATLGRIGVAAGVSALEGAGYQILSNLAGQPIATPLAAAGQGVGLPAAAGAILGGGFQLGGETVKGIAGILKANRAKAVRVPVDTPDLQPALITVERDGSGNLVAVFQEAGVGGAAPDKYSVVAIESLDDGLKIRDFAAANDIALVVDDSARVGLPFEQALNNEVARVGDIDKFAPKDGPGPASQATLEALGNKLRIRPRKKEARDIRPQSRLLARQQLLESGAGPEPLDMSAVGARLITKAPPGSNIADAVNNLESSNLRDSELATSYVYISPAGPSAPMGGESPYIAKHGIGSDTIVASYVGPSRGKPGLHDVIAFDDNNKEILLQVPAKSIHPAAYEPVSDNPNIRYTPTPEKVTTIYTPKSILDNAQQLAITTQTALKQLSQDNRKTALGGLLATGNVRGPQALQDFQSNILAARRLSKVTSQAFRALARGLPASEIKDLKGPVSTLLNDIVTGRKPIDIGIEELKRKYPNVRAQMLDYSADAIREIRTLSAALEKELGVLPPGTTDLRNEGLIEQYVTNIYGYYVLGNKEKFTGAAATKLFGDAVSQLQGELEAQGKTYTPSMVSQALLEILNSANPESALRNSGTMGKAYQSLKARVKLKDNAVTALLMPINNGPLRIATAVGRARQLYYELLVWKQLANIRTKDVSGQWVNPYWSPGPRADLTLHIPNDPHKFGEAAGGYTRPEMAHLLVPETRNAWLDSFLMRWATAAGKMTRANQLTLGSQAVRTNNLMNSMLSAMMVGVGTGASPVTAPKEFSRELARATRHLYRYAKSGTLVQFPGSEDILDATRHGIVGGGFTSSETQFLDDKVSKMIEAELLNTSNSFYGLSRSSSTLSEKLKSTAGKGAEAGKGVLRAASFISDLPEQAMRLAQWRMIVRRFFSARSSSNPGGLTPDELLVISNYQQAAKEHAFMDQLKGGKGEKATTWKNPFADDYSAVRERALREAARWMRLHPDYENPNVVARFGRETGAAGTFLDAMLTGASETMIRAPAHFVNLFAAAPPEVQKKMLAGSAALALSMGGLYAGRSAILERLGGLSKEQERAYDESRSVIDKTYVPGKTPLHIDENGNVTTLNLTNWLTPLQLLEGNPQNYPGVNPLVNLLTFPLNDLNAEPGVKNLLQGATQGLYRAPVEPKMSDTLSGTAGSASLYDLAKKYSVLPGLVTTGVEGARRMGLSSGGAREAAGPFGRHGELKKGEVQLSPEFGALKYGLGLPIDKVNLRAQTEAKNKEYVFRLKELLAEKERIIRNQKYSPDEKRAKRAVVDMQISETKKAWHKFRSPSQED